MNVPPRAAADLRLLRAAVFAAACVVLSAAGHVLASGTAVRPWALAAAWIGVWGAAVPLSGRRRSGPGIAALLAVAEAGLHLLFCVGRGAPSGGAEAGAAAGRAPLCGGSGASGPDGAARLLRLSGADPVSGAGGAGAHALHGGHAAAGAGGMDGMSVVSMLTPHMLAAHLVAAVLLGLALGRGEAALWRVVGLSADRAARFAALLPLRLAAAVLRPVEFPDDSRRRMLRARWAERRTRRPRPVPLLHAVVRRGPPGCPARP